MQTLFKYPPDEYGFTTNASDEIFIAERKAFCDRNGIASIFPLSDNERLELEIYLSKKYRKEFIEYEGYRLREKSDDTYSTTQIGIPMQFASLLQNYTAVPIEDENSKKSPTNEAEQNTSL